MEVNFEINTFKGDGIIVSLKSSYDFIQQLFNEQHCPAVEVIDMSIYRKSGSEPVPISALKEIIENTKSIISSSLNTVLFYLCDSVDPIPYIRKSRDINCQQYRDLLFGKMFERYCKDTPWLDYRIETVINGEPQFAHIIYREEFSDSIKIIGQEVQELFGIMQDNK